jgi:predicted secreted protein
MLTKEDKRKTFSVLLGSKIAVQLRENITTGYSWDRDEPDPGEDTTGLHLVSSDYTQDPAPPFMCGVGGTRMLLFQAQKPGTVHLRLKCWPSFSGEIGGRFNVTINVETAPSSKLEESRHHGKNSSSEQTISDGSGSNPNDLAKRMMTPDRDSQNNYPPVVSHYPISDDSSRSTFANSLKKMFKLLKRL